MTKLIFLFALLTTMAHGKIIDIEGFNVPFYKKGFENAKFQEKLSITDLIAPYTNTTYLKIFNDKKELLGFIRMIDTTPGCSGQCAPLWFTLVFNSDNTFKKIITRDQEELMKEYGTAEFTEADFKKLYETFRTPPDSFKNATKPEDLTEVEVDGTSGATILAYKNDVVKTAALSHFRMYEYFKQTKEKLIKNQAIVEQARAQEEQARVKREKKEAERVAIEAAKRQAKPFRAPDQYGIETNFNFLPYSRFKDKITVMMFFAIWCTYCKIEIPLMVKLQEKYSVSHPDKVEFILLRTFEKPDENLDYFIFDYNIQFTILNDNPRSNTSPGFDIAKLYGVRGVPMTFIFDGDGTILDNPEMAGHGDYFNAIDKFLQEKLN